MIQKPSNRKLPRQVNKDTRVLYRFYVYNGHDTKYCIAFRKIVECIIDEGKLDQYLADRPPSGKTTIRQSNMISGGVPIAETSN